MTVNTDTSELGLERLISKALNRHPCDPLRSGMVAEALAPEDDGLTRRTFLARLQGEITKRGTIDILRH